jgi:hypothetical protein
MEKTNYEFDVDKIPTSALLFGLFAVVIMMFVMSLGFYYAFTQMK